jgi:hypothetical protein
MDSAQLGMNAQQFVVVKAPLERVYEQWSRIIRSIFDPSNLSRRVEENIWATLNGWLRTRRVRNETFS